MTNASEIDQPVQIGPELVNVRNLLKRFDIKPDKRLGQNFLIDHRSLVKVVEAARLRPDEKVLEIGAGLGALTRLLIKRAKEVYAIELDKRLIPPLRLVLGDVSNVHIIQKDILKLDLSELLRGSRYSVVANIPYYISTAVIRNVLTGPSPPRRIVLTIQREVAERILAPVGKYGLLTLSVQIFGMPRIAGYIPAKAFYPSPKVESAILAIEVHPSPVVPSELIQPVFKLAKAGFSQKRKQLRNSLSSGLRFEPEKVEQLLLQAGIDPKQRPQELSVDDWVNVAREVETYEIDDQL
jgi:16S rRNA (adenine1518-N6/adenine1519-N6)-dimethyltransferase